MQGSRVGLLVLRAFQLIFAVIILGVSISFIRDIDRLRRIYEAFGERYDFGRIPSSFYFAAFTGAWGILDALVGLVGAFIAALPWIAVIVLDGLAAVFYFAAGMNLAVLRGRNAYHCGPLCTKWDTTTAFCFLGFIVTATIIPLVFLTRKR